MSNYGTIWMQRELDDSGRERVRIMQADATALIAAVLIGQAFAGEAPHLSIDDDRLTITDDFGQVVVYQLGRYVMGDGVAGFDLQRVETDRGLARCPNCGPSAVGE